jgi:hypothetical protein
MPEILVFGVNIEEVFSRAEWTTVLVCLSEEGTVQRDQPRPMIDASSPDRCQAF